MIASKLKEFFITDDNKIVKIHAQESNGYINCIKFTDDKGEVFEIQAEMFDYDDSRLSFEGQEIESKSNFTLSVDEEEEDGFLQEECKKVEHEVTYHDIKQLSDKLYFKNFILPNMVMSYNVTQKNIDNSKIASCAYRKTSFKTAGKWLDKLIVSNYDDFVKLNKLVFERLKREYKGREEGFKIKMIGDSVYIKEDHLTLLTLKYDIFEGFDINKIVYQMNTPRNMDLLKLSGLMSSLYQAVKDIIETEIE